MSTDLKHLSVVICGHVDSGKSTTTGHLLYKCKCSGIDDRAMEKLRAEADAGNKKSFAYAFVMDNTPEERRRGVTISTTAKCFNTEKYYYTILDAPGHRDFIKNMITGAGQADVACILVPADGNFVSAIQKPNLKAGIIQGQSRQHARLVNLLGCKQVIWVVNKMDTELYKWSKARFDEIRGELMYLSKMVGYTPIQIAEGLPCIPISGLQGVNLDAPAAEMPWWVGESKKNPADPSGQILKFHTFIDCLNNWVVEPVRHPTKPLRLPVSGVFKIKGSGDVITGRIEQGVIECGREVVFLPQHTSANPCGGKVFSVEMHHEKRQSGEPGDNVGINVKGLPGGKHVPIPTQSVMVYKDDTSIFAAGGFVVSMVALDIAGEFKPGYTPVMQSRAACCACKFVKIYRKWGKETGKEGLANPVSIKSNEKAEVLIIPTKDMVVESFENCEGLARVAIMEGNTVCGLARVIKVYKKDDPALLEELKTVDPRLLRGVVGAPAAAADRGGRGPGGK